MAIKPEAIETSEGKTLAARCPICKAVKSTMAEADACAARCAQQRSEILTEED